MVAKFIIYIISRQYPMESSISCKKCMTDVGSIVQESEKLSTEEMVAAAMEVLRRLFGEAIPKPTASTATKWGSHVYARGVQFSSSESDSTSCRPMPMVSRAELLTLLARMYLACVAE